MGWKHFSWRANPSAKPLKKKQQCKQKWFLLRVLKSQMKTQKTFCLMWQTVLFSYFVYCMYAVFSLVTIVFSRMKSMKGVSTLHYYGLIVFLQIKVIYIYLRHHIKIFIQKMINYSDVIQLIFHLCLRYTIYQVKGWKNLLSTTVMNSYLGIICRQYFCWP